MSGVTRAALAPPPADQHRHEVRRPPLAVSSGFDYVLTSGSGGDTVSTTDTVLVEASPQQVDSVTVTDGAIVNRALARVYVDSVTATDAFAFETDESTTETVSTTDTVFVSVGHYFTKADSVSLAEGLRVTSGNTYDEAVSATDTYAITRQRQLVINEGLVAEDDFGFGNYTKIRINDTESATDAAIEARVINQDITDTVTATDGAVAGRAFSIPQFDDTVEADDEEALIFGFTIEANDTVTVADAAAYVFHLELFFNDSSVVVDARTRSSAYAPIIADTVTVTDSVSRVHNEVQASHSDTPSVADTVNISLSRGILVNDTVTTLDLTTGSSVPYVQPVQPIAGQKNVAPDTNIVFNIFNGLGTAIIPSSVVVKVENVVVWTGGQPVNGWGGNAFTIPTVNGLQYVLYPPDGFAYGEDVQIDVNFFYGLVLTALPDSVLTNDAFNLSHGWGRAKGDTVSTTDAAVVVVTASTTTWVRETAMAPLGPGGSYVGAGSSSFIVATDNANNVKIDDGSGAWAGSYTGDVPFNAEFNQVWTTSPTNLFFLGGWQLFQRWDGSVWVDSSTFDASWGTGRLPIASNDSTPMSQTPFYMHGTGPNDIWIPSALDIFHSADFGASWQHLHSTTVDSIGCVFAKDATHVWFGGGSGLLIYYDGSTFAEQIVGDGSTTITSIWGSTTTDVWLADNTGQIFHATDGVTFNLVTTLAGGPNVAYMHGSGASNIWIASDQGIYHYNGTTWAKDATILDPNAPRSQIWVLSPTNVYAAGDFIDHKTS